MKDENLDSSTHCYKPFNEACIGTESQRNVTLFCDPYMSREVDRQSPIGIDKPKLDGNHSKFLKVSNGANWCYEASNTSAINKDQIINVSDEEEKNSVMLKRSTDQILALFSKRPIDTFSEGRSTEVCYAELWNASRNDITFNKGIVESRNYFQYYEASACFDAEFDSSINLSFGSSPFQWLANLVDLFSRFVASSNIRFFDALK